MNGRDEHGRFTQGNHPATGFHTNPERRGRFPGNRHSFSKAAQRLLGMTDKELSEERQRNDLTQAEHMALQLLGQATDMGNPKQLAAFQQLIDRAEGKPGVSVETDSAQETPTIHIEFADTSLGASASAENE